MDIEFDETVSLLDDVVDVAEEEEEEEEALVLLLPLLLIACSLGYSRMWHWLCY